MWDITKITDFLSHVGLTPKFMAFISIVSAFLLFTPSRYLAAIGVSEIALRFHQWIGLALVISVAFQIPFSVWPWGQYRWKLHKIRQHAKHTLHHLLWEQEELLATFFFNRADSMLLDISQTQAANTLAPDGIVVPHPNQFIGMNPPKWVYSIAPWAKRYIKKHPAVLARCVPAKNLREWGS
jgi:hypothetical protein